MNTQRIYQLYSSSSSRIYLLLLRLVARNLFGVKIAVVRNSRREAVCAQGNMRVWARNIYLSAQAKKLLPAFFPPKAGGLFFQAPFFVNSPYLARRFILEAPLSYVRHTYVTIVKQNTTTCRHFLLFAEGFCSFFGSFFLFVDPPPRKKKVCAVCNKPFAIEVCAFLT